MANSTIIYAGTRNGLAIFNKPGTSPDWLPARMALGGRAVLSVWAETGPPIRVVAAAENPGELLLSESGGRDWEPRLDAPVTTIFATPDETARLYAGMNHGGLAGSVDGGGSWGILPGIELGGSIRVITADLKEPGRLYILLQLGDGETALIDGIPEQVPWRRQALAGITAFSQEAPTDDLYACTTEGVYLSADKGDTWAALPGSPAHGKAITVIPGPQNGLPALVVGTPEGLFVSPDDGGTWQQAEVPQDGVVVAIARDPERRDRVYAATDTGFVFESGNRGQSWQPVNSQPVAEIKALYVLRI